jgi:HNH endonuclease
MVRRPLRESLKRSLLFEAGYQCGNPVCRQMLTLEFHHLTPVAKAGGNSENNLIALCPNCHALHHKGIIPDDALRTWKTVLVSLNAFSTRETINHLLLLSSLQPPSLLRANACLPGIVVTGDGVATFSSLIAAGLADIMMHEGSSGFQGMPPYEAFTICMTEKGMRLVEAWKEGNLEGVNDALAAKSPAK